MKKGVKPEPPRPQQDNQEKLQAQTFDKAMSLFHRKDFGRARGLFQQASTGPAVEMSHAAIMHVRMCERRLGAAENPRTPEEQYSFGVALMNRGEHDKAEVWLRKAVAADERADHFHYALALCAGLRGDLDTSARHLRRAIEIQPSNRVAARNDADFQSLAHHPAVRAILSPERSASG